MQFTAIINDLQPRSRFIAGFYLPIILLLKYFANKIIVIYCFLSGDIGSESVFVYVLFGWRALHFLSTQH
jgi:hypothetical protein